MLGSIIFTLLKITGESAGERLLKIGQDLAKLWPRGWCCIQFFWPTCVVFLYFCCCHNTGDCYMLLSEMSVIECIWIMVIFAISSFCLYIMPSAVSHQFINIGSIRDLLLFCLWKCWCVPLPACVSTFMVETLTLGGTCHHGATNWNTEDF